MIHGIISFSIRNKLIVMLFTIAIIIAGIWSISKVPIDAVPDITNNQVQVITQSLNLGTEEIEQYVSYPIEMAVSNLPGVLEIRSVSRFGLSVVTIVFEDDMGTYLPRQLVAEKLNELRDEIPENFGTPIMGPITTGLGEIYQYTLEVDSAFKDQYSLYDLRTIQDWIIKRQMSMIPGVIEINAFGGAVKQYEVAINPHQLNAMNISMDEVFQALQDNNANTGGAYIEYDYRANFIRGEGLVRNISDIENIVVKTINEVPIKVKDVAKVGFGNAVRYGAFTKNGEGEAVGGIVMMLKGENSNDVIKLVKERMIEIEASLPEGISIEGFLDRTELIKSTTSTVTTNLTEGALIVIFVLVFLLGNWRGGLIVASTIPISLLFAFILMNVFDVWANLMSLGAIDFGIIVDGAVIIVEGTVFLLYQKVLNKEKIDASVRDETAEKASKEMMRSAFFGQLIILIVFLPILALQGIEGKMFQPMALTFIFAMIGVIILCFTYVPMMSAWFLRAGGKSNSWGDRFVHWLENKYEYGLRSVMNFGVWIVSTAVILLVLAYITFSSMGGEFIPRLDEGDIAFHDIMRPGTAMSESVKITSEVEKVLLEEFPEVKQVLSKVGVADLPTDIMPMDLADCYIILKPKDEWVTADSKEELIQKMKARLLQIPGINYEFTQPIEMRFNELMTGIRQDVAVKIFGEDLDLLASKAREVSNLISNVEGVGDIHVEATEGQPQISIQYDRNKLAFYGLNISDLNTLVSSALAGRKAGTVFEGEKKFDLVIRLDDRFKSDLSDVKNLQATLPSGKNVPLSEIADVAYRPGPMQISRDNTHRRTYVGINVRGRDVKSLIEEIRGVLDENLDLPPGYYIQYGGAFENLERATQRLQIVVPISLGLIFLLVFLALRSLKQTIMIYVAIPLAAIGGVFSLWLRDMPFSISAGIGFIVLFGIAVLNGLVLINGWNDLKENTDLPLKDRIIQGARRRIRPILLTASTDILGFMPMALSSSAGAEVQRPLATVVIGGMLTATLLTLFVLPVLYSWTEKGMGNKPKIVMASLFILFLASVNSVNAQEVHSISMEEAIQRASEVYPSIQAAELMIEKQEKLKKTSLDLGNTGIFNAGEEIGEEFNGVNTIIGFQQQNIDIFSSPARKKRFEAYQRLSESNKELVMLDLKRKVREDYANAFIAFQKLKLFEKIDSIYTAFERAATLRLEVDATSRLEYLAAANEARQVNVQRGQAEYDYSISLQNLNRWLLSDTLFQVKPEDRAWMQPVSSEIDSLATHPEILLAQNQVLAREQEVSLEKAGYWPKLNAMYGIQNVNGRSGFHQYQVGLTFPLFFNQQKGNVQAAKVETAIAQQNLSETTIQLNNQYEVAMANYEKWFRSWEYYKDQAIPTAEEQLRGAALSYREGAIDYVAFLQNSNSALETELRGLESLALYLQSKFYLMYLLKK
ncbi:CusA/CzcA family heavy metal efflux RND transporter [Algoriphagus sediminis]|uniref:CusA/CzcA family heavy metal efflux RND transporter n=1 Tax=Algoriphagus sediminis TaxID=3057113 RepID=A0ABT7YD08_9BACT|nr:CusA/CzcA family heavy metal efflux RND transporter [Algoriphagus sediminis]MDN3204412.1 CusA/CzcA family heavy metal efflux RND transporter [Algoriphagus sediminis]